LPLKRTREKASDQFSDYVSLLEQKYNIKFTKAFHNINNGTSHSAYRDTATRCYLVMQQRFKNDLASFQTRFRRFEALQPAEQTLGYLFRLMEEEGHRPATPVYNTSPSKVLPAIRHDPSTTFTTYRSHSGEDSATTSFTSTTSKNSVSSATSVDDVDDLPSVSPPRKARYSHTKGRISCDDLALGLSSDFEIELDLSPRNDDPESQKYEDSWLRRRGDPDPTVSETGNGADSQHAVDETDLPSSWPYATQLESHATARSPRRAVVHDLKLPHLSHEADTVDDQRAAFEDYRVRDLPGQGLFGKRLNSAHVHIY